MVIFLWVAAALTISLCVYHVGRLVGKQEGKQMGRAEERIRLRLELQLEGRCPICDDEKSDSVYRQSEYEG